MPCSRQSSKQASRQLPYFSFKSSVFQHPSLLPPRPLQPAFAPRKAVRKATSGRGVKRGSSLYFFSTFFSSFSSSVCMAIQVGSVLPWPIYSCRRQELSEKGVIRGPAAEPQEVKKWPRLLLQCLGSSQEVRTLSV